MNATKGNPLKFEVGPVYMDGVLMTTLAAMDAIIFVIKNKKADADASAFVRKTVGSGITVNSPATGYLTILVSSTECDTFPVKTFYRAIQLEKNGERIEIELTENGDIVKTIIIDEDIVIGGAIR